MDVDIHEQVLSLLNKILTCTSTYSDELFLRKIASSLKLCPTEMRACVLEVLLRKNWVAFDDRIGISLDSDTNLLSNLVESRMGPMWRITNILSIYDRVTDSSMIPDTIRLFMDMNYSAILPNMLNHIMNEKNPHTLIMAAMYDISQLFTRDTVNTFEKLLLRHAHEIGHAVYIRSRGIGDNNMYAELISIITDPSTVVCTFVLWQEIKREIVLAFINLDNNFVENCYMIFSQDYKCISFIRPLMSSNNFARALLIFLKKIYRENRIVELISTYVSYSDVINYNPITKSMTFINTPKFAVKMLHEYALRKWTGDINGIMALISQFTTKQLHEFVRLYCVQTIRRVLLFLSTVLLEISIADRLSYINNPIFSGLITFIISIQSSNYINNSTIEPVLICKYLLPEHLPSRSAILPPDVFPQITATVNNLCAANTDIEARILPYFGKAEFELETSTGVYVISGESSHYIVAMCLAHGMGRRDILHVLGGDERLLNRTLDHMRTNGLLLEDGDNNIELCTSFYSDRNVIVLSSIK